MYSAFKLLLQEKNTTTYKVSKDTGISQTTLSDWKHNKSKPKIDKLMILAEYFGVDVTYFLNN